MEIAIVQRSDVDCYYPIEEYYNDSQRLANLDSLFAIPYTFRYPEIAKDQHTLNFHLGQKSISRYSWVQD
jgi:hypothetical protein